MRPKECVSGELGQTLEISLIQYEKHGLGNKLEYFVRTWPLAGHLQENAVLLRDKPVPCRSCSQCSTGRGA